MYFGDMAVKWDFDARQRSFVQRVKEHRGRNGWTQTDLAREMKARGFAFHQQTIQRLEDGRRPVRLDEAFAFADIFDVSMPEMTYSWDGMRAAEIFDAYAASSHLSTGLELKVKAAFEDLARLKDSLEYGREPEGAAAGVEILRRVVATLDQMVESADESVEPYWNALEHHFPDRDSDVAPLPSDPVEASVREFLAKAEPDEALAELSLTELAIRYEPSWEEGMALGGVDQEET